jgi:methylmalonyl-CoA mutase cobalamin-binding domain/chain
MDASPQVIIPILFEEMKKRGMEHIPVVVGGIIPEKDEAIIREAGVKDVFRPYYPLEALPQRVEAIVAESAGK